MKTVKRRLSKKYLKRKKSGAWFCLSLGWLNIIERKIIEHQNSVGAGAYKVKKIVSLWTNFDPIFLIFTKRGKAELSILKKSDLSTFTEIL